MDSPSLRSFHCSTTQIHLRNHHRFLSNTTSFSRRNCFPEQTMCLYKHAIFCRVSSPQSSRQVVGNKTKIKSKSESGKVELSFRLDHQVEFDDNVMILGSIKELGFWKKKFPMKWTDSGWICQLDFKGADSFEYKFVIVKKDKSMVWEAGDNRVLKLPKGGSFEIVSHWNSTGEEVSLLPFSLEHNEVEVEDMNNSGDGVTDAADVVEVDTSPSVGQWQGKPITFMFSNELQNQETERKWDSTGLQGFALKIVEDNRNARNWWRKMLAKALGIPAKSVRTYTEAGEGRYPFQSYGWMKVKVRNTSQLGFKGGAQDFKFLVPVQKTRLFAIPNRNDGRPSAHVLEEDNNTNHAPCSEAETFFSKWTPPGYLWRGLSVLVLAGQVITRIIKGKVHWRNTLQQLERVGPRSVGVCLLTAAFVGMAFTIQFVREFTRLGLNRAVGGVLALAFSRELSPVVTSIVVAGRIGSAFAAELGTMQVSEQTDTLRVLGSNPVDYLVTPRVIATCVALPFLTLMCFTIGMASSALLADGVFGVSINIILDSAQRALRSWDIISAMIKSQVFGAIVSVVSCAWGVTTLGGAKGVGESTTSAVVISLLGIFIADFALSYFFFQGAGDSLKNL